VRLAAMLLLVHLVLGVVIGSAQPLLRSRDGKSDGNGGSAGGGGPSTHAPVLTSPSMGRRAEGGR